ncbi:MAG: hypothetical protein U0401_24760, partial [Anaerolineae bacterium]
IPTSTPAEKDETLDHEYRQVQIFGLKRQLIDQTKNLNKLQEQAAAYGSLGNAPLNLQNEIETLETLIEELKEQLAELEQSG